MEKAANTLMMEKQRDYRNVVITQSILISIALVLQDFIQLLGFIEQRQIFYSIFLLLGAVYYYMLWDLIRNFIHNKTIIYGMVVLMVADFSVLLIVEFPFEKLVADPVPYLIGVHSVLFITEVFVMIYVFIDIFSKSEVHFGELWGAVSLFLMMTIAFASIYDIINFIQPNSFGNPLEPGFPSFAESLYFSLVTIGGGTPSFPSFTHLVRDVAAIEGVWGTLYLVILIGRIIGRV